MQTGAATVGSSMEILQNITNRSAFQPSDPTSGKIPEGAQNTNSEHKHPYVHCSIIYNRQYMEAAQFPSTDEWIKQLWGRNLHNGILLGHKKEEKFTLCNGMDGSGEYSAK